MAIEVGNVLEGRVTGVKPFGAFVALPEGKSGMVHISEVSNEYVQDINTVLHDGDAVKVQVINIAPDGKIALSIKRLLPPAPRQPRSIQFFHVALCKAFLPPKLCSSFR